MTATGSAMLRPEDLEPAARRTMRALRTHQRGGPERLVYEDAPIPHVGVGDALVRVRAAAITPAELAWEGTWVDRAGRDRRPTIPAHEVSGVVAALGNGTTGISVGQAVYGLTDWYRDGAAAEYVAVEARNLAPKPASLGHVEAAAVPLPGLTAWQALFVHGRLAADQTVLVHGAGGGVGSFAVQLARGAGARVVAADRPWARDLALDLGADAFIDVEQEPFEDVVGLVDLVFDPVGGDVLERSWSVVKQGGAVVSIVGQPSTDQARRRGARGVFFVVEPSRPGLVELARRIDAGALRVVVGGTFPLAEGRRAFEAKQDGGVPGKVVLQVAGDS
jgi:NADPH:quinone reductase-like Zn-dependent oxidoreductase